MQSPNVLLITSDQQRADHLGLAGMRAIPTPNLDRLGREGMHVARAYTASPLCTPARVSLLTGQYPSVHGATSIGVTADPFPQDLITYRLKAAGYTTALFGKAHFVARPDEEAHVLGREASGPRDFEGFDGPYIGFDHVRLSRGHTINTVPDMHYRLWLERQGVDYKQWFPQLGGNYDHHAAGPWDIPAELHDTHWVTEEALAWLKTREGQAAPWFCWASYQDPHEPHVCPEPWYSRVDPAEVVPYAGARSGEFDDKPPFYAEAARGDWSRYNDGVVVPCCFRTPERDARRAACLQATYGMIGFLDHAVGRLIHALEAAGQLENTLIIYTSDHGDMHGHHGFWGKGLPAYEDAQRVPLLIAGAGVKAQGSRPALANLVDLPATILDCCGAAPAPAMQGVSLRPLLSGETDSVQQHTFVECQATEHVLQETLISDRLKLVAIRGDDNGELYDLEADPDQYRNLWNDAGYTWMRMTMQGELVRRAARHPRVGKRKAFA